MNTAELKKLADAATPGPWMAGGASVTAAETEDFSGLEAKLYGGNGQQKARNARYIAAVNPAAILKLLEINAELVEALKGMVMAWGSGFDEGDSPSLDKARAALAKAEVGEL